MALYVLYNWKDILFMGCFLHGICRVSYNHCVHMFSSTGFPILAVVWQLLTLSWCPESPRFLLIQKNSEAEAIQGIVYNGLTNPPELWPYKSTWTMTLQIHLNYGLTNLPELWPYKCTWTMALLIYLNYGLTNLPELWLYKSTWNMALQIHLNYDVTNPPELMK